MRSLLAGFTTRGTSFLAAGLAAALAGLALGERNLVSVGALLFILPLLSALAAGRARYRLSCVRQVSPARVPAGHTTHVSVRLENVSRLPTGLLLAEDSIPYPLGSRPRYVLDGVERGGVRELTYPLRSDLRGKFTIGPLEVRIADSFGLVELGRSFATTSTLVVTPKVIPLPRTAIGASWVGEGEGKTRAAAAAGEDDVVPRAYRDGDELRRVHWRSTARYGELMVRREEQRWRNRALLLLDTRRGAHGGSGIASSFEYAVEAAASIGVHLARGGMDGQLITDAGPVAATGIFEDVLLDSLAVMKASRGTELSAGLAAVRAAGGGLLIVIAGRISATAARQLATSRRDGGPAIALLLAVSTWSEPQVRAQGQAASGGGPEQPGQPASDRDQRTRDPGVLPGATPLAQVAGPDPHQQAPANDQRANGQLPNGQRTHGQRTHGQRTDGQRTDGQRTHGQRTHGQRTHGQRTHGQRTHGQQAAAAAPGGKPDQHDETSAAAAILTGAGWRVLTVRAGMPLATAWQRLAGPGLAMRPPSAADRPGAAV